MKSKALKTALDYLFITAGSVIYAFSVNIFTAPNNIAPGGFTGIATVFNYLIGFPIGTFIFLANIPLFIWGAIENGKGFLTKTIIGTLLVSVSIDVFAPFLPKYTGETILAAIFGGLLSGAGLALIFYRGGTTGGTDIIARNLYNKFPHISMGTIILVLDAVIIIFAGVVYKSLESVLFAVIAIFISIKTIDAIIYGVAHDNGKLMFIITDKYQELTEKIMENVVRGVTILDGHGGYKYDNKKVLLCACRPHQVHKINQLVKKIDINAFVVVTTATAINGKGFSKQQ